MLAITGEVSNTNTGGWYHCVENAMKFFLLVLFLYGTVISAEINIIRWTRSAFVTIIVTFPFSTAGDAAVTATRLQSYFF